MECTLRGIFQQHFEAYAARRRVPLYVHRAAYWISSCRTAALGGHVRRCPAGHMERAFYNSRHQRGCPQCQAMATEAWLARQRERLLARAHHHLIFTMPHDLNDLWRWNRASMAALLFETVRSVLLELLGDPKYLGAKPAFLAALHTWGRSLSLHPHLHVLAADGGLDDSGAWVAPRRSHFPPALVLMPLFRGKLLAAPRERIGQGQLGLPPDLSRERAFTLRIASCRLWPCAEVDCRVRITSPAGPSGCREGEGRENRVAPALSAMRSAFPYRAGFAGVR